MNRKENLQLEYRKTLARAYANLAVREKRGFRTPAEKELLETFLTELKGLVREAKRYPRAA